MRGFVLLVSLITIELCVLPNRVQGRQSAPDLEHLRKQVESGRVSAQEALQKTKEAGLAVDQAAEATAETEKQPRTRSREPGPGAGIERALLPEETLGKGTTDTTGAPVGAEKYFGYDLFGGAPEGFQPVRTGPVDPDYQIGPGDEIILSLWGDTELRHVLTVSREGAIYVENVGQIVVNGLTLKRLEQKLINTMSKVYKSLLPPSGSATTFLDVSLGKLKPITVFFVGELKKPGAYQVDSYSTAFTALYYVGGPTQDGSLREIQVVRGGLVVTSFDLYDYLLTGKKVRDVRLQNGDTIFVPARRSTITLRGEVLSPAVFELLKGETLEDLVKFSGGLRTSADLSRVQIERILPFEQRQGADHLRVVVDKELAGVTDGAAQINPVRLFDEDLVTVFPVLDPQLGYVTLSGAVFRPGKYALEEGMTIHQLIQKGQGFLPDAYLEKADLTRTYLDRHTEHFDIDLASAQPDTFGLQDLDDLRVYSIWDLFDKEFVRISGHVRKPGEYALHDNLHVSDLLFKAGGLRDPYFWHQTYQKRADLVRYNEDRVTTRVIPIKLDSLMAGDVKQDLLLRHRDHVIVYDLNVIHEPEVVSITGEIKKPGEYDLQTNMGLHDLILRAGGFAQGAFKYEVTVYRTDPYSITGDTLAVAHGVCISPEMLSLFRTTDDFWLQDRDLVAVRRHPGFEYQREVEIRGEVRFPGTYSLLTKKETLRRLVARSGGLTEEAFVEGLQFSRAGQKMVGNFRQTLFGRGRFDIPLVAGDEIFIPKRPGIVTVDGSVNAPGALKYQKGWSLGDYVGAAGGFSRDADKGAITVYYPNGTARFKGWLFSPSIKEGSRIVVSKKEEKAGVDWTEFLKETTSIAASLATVVFIVSRTD